MPLCKTNEMDLDPRSTNGACFCSCFPGKPTISGFRGPIYACVHLCTLLGCCVLLFASLSAFVCVSLVFGFVFAAPFCSHLPFLQGNRLSRVLRRPPRQAAGGCAASPAASAPPAAAGPLWRRRPTGCRSSARWAAGSLTRPSQHFIPLTTFRLLAPLRWLNPRCAYLGPSTP